MDSALMANYGHPRLAFERGSGCYLYTADGTPYLDFTMGIAVNCLGHCHPALIEALQVQANRLWHSSNLFRIEPAEALASELVAHTFADRVLFCNSGTEAVECGFKMMRRYHHDKGRPERRRIIALENSFHGRTLAPIAASANPAHCDGFLSGEDAGFDQLTYGDIAALRSAVGDETAGIILEPVQGEGGVRVTDTDYLRQVRQLCDEQGILLMFDEVQCGMGRCGELFAYQALGVAPDLLASAKGLGGGFPIGACLATEDAAAPMVAGTHGSTFGGNPLATSVAGEVLRQITAPGFLAHSRKRAAQLRSGLDELIHQYPGVIKAHTGLALMVGLQCTVDNSELVNALQERQMLAVKAGSNMVRLLPPLNVSVGEIDSALTTLADACHSLTGTNTSP